LDFPKGSEPEARQPEFSMAPGVCEVRLQTLTVHPDEKFSSEIRVKAGTGKSQQNISSFFYKRSGADGRRQSSNIL
jgi:hypothetical protein